MNHPEVSLFDYLCKFLSSPSPITNIGDRFWDCTCVADYKLSIANKAAFRRTPSTTLSIPVWYQPGTMCPLEFSAPKRIAQNLRNSTVRMIMRH